MSTVPPGVDPAFLQTLAEADHILRTEYGFRTWALNDPELHDVFLRAVIGGWFGTPAGEAKLQGALSNTNWWKTHSEPARAWLQMQGEDTQTAALNLKNKKFAILQIAKQVGLTLDDKTLGDMADTALMNGWGDTDAQLRQMVLDQTHFDPKAPPAGDLAGIMNKITQTANGKYLLPLSADTAYGFAQQVLAGTLTQDGLNAYLVQQAKSRYPGLIAQIDQGITPGDFFSSYQEQTGRLLGMAPASINLEDPKWAPMTEVVDPKGNRRPMTLDEAGRYARSQPEFQNSANGRQLAAQAALFFGNRFGETTT